MNMSGPSIWIFRIVAALHILVLFTVYQSWRSLRTPCVSEHSGTINHVPAIVKGTAGNREEGHNDSNIIFLRVDLDKQLSDKCKEFFASGGSKVEEEPLVEATPKLFACDDFTPRRHYGRRGSYWVLYNYVKAERSFRCDQSITFTTHTDYKYLDNLAPLLERWRGPISLSLYTPGSDFNETLKRILYLRECTDSSLVKEYVTFHLFFHQSHVPNASIIKEPEQLPVGCPALSKTFRRRKQPTYRQRMNLTYPINVGRNVAKEMATTHYVFPCDIELYPSPNLIPDFMDMQHLMESTLQGWPLKVFVVTHFELEANVKRLPKDKRELVHLLENNSAIPFHSKVCSACHDIPRTKEWQQEPMQPGLGVFHVTKRVRKLWEPFFIGTKFDPMYDERLSWEGKKDKMLQNYILCLLDYEFHILDNAFLVHRPGIKKPVPQNNRTRKPWQKQNRLIDKVIRPELEKIYGKRSGCNI